MPSQSSYHRLVEIHFVKQLPYLLRRFIPIHKRHITVHQYKFIITPLLIVLNHYIVRHSLQRLNPVQCWITDFDVYLNAELQHDLNSINIEPLVIHNKYPIIFFLYVWNRIKRTMISKSEVQFLSIHSPGSYRLLFNTWYNLIALSSLYDTSKTRSVPLLNFISFVVLGYVEQLLVLWDIWHVLGDYLVLSFLSVLLKVHLLF